MHASFLTLYGESRQVQLAMADYQLPRLTRMWSHLERQSGGGQVRGMGEKQLEIDKRLLRQRMSALRAELDEVCCRDIQYIRLSMATSRCIVHLTSAMFCTRR